MSDTLNFEELAASLLTALKDVEHLLIYIKGSPDPDAISASYALKLICEAHDTRASILSPKQVSLPQNVKLIKDLHLPVRFEPVEECKDKYDAYAVLDHQSVFVENVTGVIPCALHIDHHEPVNEEIPVALRIYSEIIGSVSTVMILLMHQLTIDLSTSDWRNASTALYYGILSDTDDLLHAEPLDHEAVNVILPYADKEALDRIASVPFTKAAMKYLKLALENQYMYKDWMICGIGYIPEKHRDNLAIIGDFLIKREDVSVVVVFGIVEKDHHLVLDASFRTKEEQLNLNALIKNITRDGGARKFKGAFQVNLDYFAYCPDRDLLWKTVYLTTIETLKMRRDDDAGDELSKLFSFLKRKIKEIFD